jgi:aspartyl-tRNA(Asn)/glutamyl-tRNA(Gln) amidotransferase subunit A
VTWNKFTDARVQRLARRVGLRFDDSDASEFIDPLSEISASMTPVEQPPWDESSTPAVTSISRPDPYNAFITRCRIDPPESANGSLTDREVALKDNIALAGVERTAGSAVLAGHVPSRNAPVVARLRAAGATIVGKTNMDEFAFGPTGETSAFGPTLNPVDPDKTPGGSSSGSAAAVAANDVDLALGTDTGGSVRIPASFCGVYGFKPTQGHVPIEGIVELSRSLDTVGVLGRELRLVERCYEALTDEADNTVEAVDVSGLDIGIPDTLFDRPSDVGAVVDDAVEQLVDAGATVMSVKVPTPDLTSAIWRSMTMSEFYRYVATGSRSYRILDAGPGDEGLASALRSNIDRFSEPLRQYLLMGAAIVHDDDGRRYANALAHRRDVRDAIGTAMDDVDVLACPTTPTTAFEFGSFSRADSRPINGNTHAFNLSGNPALSVPCGESDGLPVGLQLIAPHGADRRLFGIAEGIEDLLPATTSTN